MILEDRIASLFAQGGSAPRHEAREVFFELRAALSAGRVRAAEPDPVSPTGWRVNVWVKQGILLGFRFGDLVDMGVGKGRWPFFDKDTLPLKQMDVTSRVRIVPGSGEWTVNGRTLESYFPNKLHQQVVNEPFAALQLDGRFDVIARIHGGGITGQAGALRLGVARALNAIDVEANRPTLKKAGLLTRDARVIERKEAGLKKARKAPQFSKR